MYISTCNKNNESPAPTSILLINMHLKKEKRKKKVLQTHKKKVSFRHVTIRHVEPKERGTLGIQLNSLFWLFTGGVCATLETINMGRHGKKNDKFHLKGFDCYTTLLKRCMNHWFFSLRCRSLHSTYHGRCKIISNSKIKLSAILNFHIKEVVR